MNINQISIDNWRIIYNINGLDYTAKLPEKAINFIKQYHIWLYDLATTETKESEQEFILNSIESQSFIKPVFSNNQHKIIDKTFYKHTIFVFNEYEFRKRVVNILKTNHPNLEIYYNSLNDFPIYWYIKHWYKIYWNYNNSNNINEYPWTSIIEDLETWKREFQQIDYYNPKNWFNFKYYIDSKNEVKFLYDLMIEELKQEFNIS